MVAKRDINLQTICVYPAMKLAKLVVIQEYLAPAFRVKMGFTTMNKTAK